VTSSAFEPIKASSPFLHFASATSRLLPSLCLFVAPAITLDALKSVRALLRLFK